MTDKISREKYEKIKSKAQSWYDKAIEYEGDLEQITYENEQLKSSLEKSQKSNTSNSDILTENSQLKNTNKEYERDLKQLTYENQQLKIALSTFKNSLEKSQKSNTSNSNILAENSQLKNNIKELNAKITIMERETATIEFQHEKQLLQKDSQIERYKTSLEDYKERYYELKEDNKELRKNK
jgi:hypothetical protein